METPVVMMVCFTYLYQYFAWKDRQNLCQAGLNSILSSNQGSTKPMIRTS